MKRLDLLATVFALGLAQAAAADEISDTLKSALEAYEGGDVKYALEELEYAKQLMTAIKTEALVGFLPEPQDGWTREINTEMNAGLAIMGGGTGAEATYSRPDAEDFTITIMADNPMVGAMAGMLGSAAAIGAKIERIGRQKFMVKDGEYTALVDSRILVQAKGGAADAIMAALDAIDYKGLGDFGR